MRRHTSERVRLAQGERKEFLKVDDVANLLGLRPVTIYRWCRSGRLPGMKIGKEWRIPLAAVDDILHRNLNEWLSGPTDEGVMMREASPAATEFAERILWHEAGDNLAADTLATAAEHTFRRLRLRLASMLGQSGYIALLKRALRLALRSFPILNELSIDEKSNTGLIGFHEFSVDNSANPESAVDAITAILAQFIWLLVTFVGDELTVRLIDELWPGIANVPGRAAHARTET